ncbi:MAG: hypothetical protein J6D02_04005 [Lachnospira sp.]|nr:hypothetical protein [Lachnospira sp.]
MAAANGLSYDKWTVASLEEQKKIAKAFRFRGMGMLVGYIVLLAVIVTSILINIFFQQVNLVFVIIFLLLALGTVAGLGNQVKIVRQMKQNRFEIRDAVVKKINYTNKRRYNITSYELEISERNVIKTIVVSRSYQTFRPRIGDVVLLAKPQKTMSIYFYERLKEGER